MKRFISIILVMMILCLGVLMVSCDEPIDPAKTETQQIQPRSGGGGVGSNVPTQTIKP
jgi:hypothetical protein